MTMSFEENIPRHQQRGNVVFPLHYKIQLHNMATHHISQSAHLCVGF